LPKQCTHLSSFARHPHRSTCKRYSKSCSQRRSTSNVSSLRLKGSVSPCCFTLMFECPGWIDQLIRSAPCIRADCTHTRCWSVSRRDATYLGWIGPGVSTLLPLHFGHPAPIIYIPLCPLLHYLSSFRSTVAAAYHALPHRPVALFIPHVATRLYPYFRPVYFPYLLVCFTLGGPR
jgi:hypothetical protein